MIPITQTRVHTESGPPGNCFPAAIASLLHCDLDAVPQPEEGDRNDWGAYWPRVAEFLACRGLFMLLVPHGPDSHESTATYAGWERSLCMAMGMGPRGHRHVVVYRGHELVHDPHPSRAGLVSIEALAYLVPLDPAEHGQ